MPEPTTDAMPETLPAATVEDVMDVVVSILRQDCGIGAEEEVGPDTDLQLDLGLESVGLLTVVAELENHYRLVIEEEPDDPPTTVRAIAELVVAQLAGAAS